MIIPSPSQLIKGGDIIATFQNLYNLLFAILLALVFLSFIYGAFQYLLSGANIFNQQEGKSRMKNSLIALIVVLIIPVLLNLINPKIFKGAQMTVPKFTVKVPTFADIIGDVYIDELPDGTRVPTVDNAIYSSIPGLPYGNITKETSLSILTYILYAYIAAKNTSTRKIYSDEHPGNLSLASACNYFVYFALQEANLVPGGACPYGASRFHLMLTKRDFQNIAIKNGFEWKIIRPKKGGVTEEDVLPGDILVRTIKLINGHGHVGIVVPLRTNKNGFYYGSAEASYSTNIEAIRKNPGRYLPHIRKISQYRFDLIVRPIPITNKN
jgi:hypothetical protein